MVSVPVQCPYCHSTEVIKAGKQANGTQRYRCPNAQCIGGSCSSNTRIEAEYLKSAARSSTWLSMAAASATPLACHARPPHRVIHEPVEFGCPV